MMILKFIGLAIFLDLIIECIILIIKVAKVTQKSGKNAKHKNATIPVSEASPAIGNSTQRNRTSSVQNRTSSVAAGQRGQRAGRQAPPPVPRQVYRYNRQRQIIRNGPGGLRPTRFPSCPICRAKNFPGEQQVIFWHEQGQFYTCQNGHKFKKNGALF
ncbi:hypothetical protein [uncultured Eubacterium sp.]|uniref:hypothetical protein n=1 Tax=uncultured Eubacterium sp. TaxID=165185 RepID=UPI0025EDB7BE|nr:hypothetical protein [uncultured Eubacterium sp.]